MFAVLLSGGIVEIPARGSDLPIVTTGAPGCRGIMHEGESGFLVAVPDAQAFAEALCGLIASVALLAKMDQ